METDANVQWRLRANRAVLEQFREQPLVGVGFGRRSGFFIEVENETTGLPALRRVEIGQDPHNGYVFLLAGGGILALGTFALLLGTFAIDVVRRYRTNSDPRARLTQSGIPQRFSFSSECSIGHLFRQARQRPNDLGAPRTAGDRPAIGGPLLRARIVSQDPGGHPRSAEANAFARGAW